MEGPSAVRKKLRGRRDWVKNAIIVFLAVMLVLTFFSNTIMNYSLPEVAAQYPLSTSVVTRIRGSGTVEAAQNYEVSVSETRNVTEVKVKVGDTVAAGDTLFTLDATESEELVAARNEYNNLKLEYDKMLLTPSNQTNQNALALSQAEAAVTKAQTDLTNARTYETNLKPYEDEVTSCKANVASCQAAVTSWELEVTLNEASFEESGNREGLDIALTKKAEADANLTLAESALTTAEAARDAFQAAYTGISVKEAEAALTSAQDALDTLKATQADEAAKETYDASVAALDLAAKEQELNAAQQKVETLEKKASATSVVTSYAGVVSQVNLAAGNNTVPDEPMIVIEVTGKGYTLKSAVKKEQARYLTVGMNAEVTNNYGSDITMTLASIGADPNDPANGRMLTFQITGTDVTVGSTLNYSIGNKSDNYDIVLPTSAIHTDSDGSFVYAVTVKSSPLGNRYSVKKCKVDVIASDDTNSAVNGTLTTTDFIITTSTTPLEPGMKIRIAE